MINYDYTNYSCDFDGGNHNNDNNHNDNNNHNDHTSTSFINSILKELEIKKIELDLAVLRKESELNTKKLHLHYREKKCEEIEHRLNKERQQFTYEKSKYIEEKTLFIAEKQIHRYTQKYTKELMQLRMLSDKQNRHFQQQNKKKKCEDKSKKKSNDIIEDTADENNTYDMEISTDTTNTKKRITEPLVYFLCKIKVPYNSLSSTCTNLVQETENRKLVEDWFAQIKSDISFFLNNDWNYISYTITLCLIHVTTCRKYHQQIEAYNNIVRLSIHKLIYDVQLIEILYYDLHHSKSNSEIKKISQFICEICNLWKKIVLSNVNYLYQHSSSLLPSDISSHLIE